jgi:hypothetical protein
MIHGLKVNVEVLSKSPHAELIVRLLAVSNDIKTIGYLTQLAVKDASPAEPHERKFSDGISWYLLRQRTSIATEGITEFIQKIRRHENSAILKEIWDIIKQTPNVEVGFRTLVDYLPAEKSFPEGKFFRHLSANRFVRDKFTAHYDASIPKNAMAAAIEHAATSDQNMYDYWLSDMSGGPRTRASFVDTIFAVAWFSAHEIPLHNRLDPNSSETLNAVHHIDAVLGAFSFFTDLVGVEYCKRYKIFDQADLDQLSGLT